MTQGYSERPTTPLARRLLVLRATTLGALGLTLGGCILRDGVAGGMFSGGGITDSDLGDASGHGRGGAVRPRTNVTDRDSGDPAGYGRRTSASDADPRDPTPSGPKAR